MKIQVNTPNGTIDLDTTINTCDEFSQHGLNIEVCKKYDTIKQMYIDNVTNKVYISNGLIPQDWQEITFVGTKGDKGDKGDTGTKGDNQIMVVPAPVNPIYPLSPTMIEDFENFMMNNIFTNLFTETFTTGW